MPLCIGKRTRGSEIKERRWHTQSCGSSRFRCLLYLAPAA